MKVRCRCALGWLIRSATTASRAFPNKGGCWCLRPQGFQNVDPQAVLPRPFGDFVRWQWQRAGLDIAAPKMDLAPVAPDPELVRASANRFAVTWIGHATALVQIGTLRFLTDPHFSERASPVQWAGPKRHQAPGFALADLPHIDVV